MNRMAAAGDAAFLPAGDRPMRATYLTLLVALPAAMFDGFDGQLVAFLSPAIAQDWQLPKASFGWIFSIGLIGLVIGAALVAPLADRLGRRRIAVTGAVMVTLFTALTSLVRTPVELAALRMLTGIGLGTLMSVLVTITQETAPPRLKGIFVTLLVTAFPFGSFVGAMAVAAGLEHGTWRQVFQVAALVSAAFPVLFWLFLSATPPAPKDHSGMATTTVRTLFRDRRWKITLLLWTLFFVSLLNIYTLSAWTPLLLQRAGVSIPTALHITAVLGLGGTFGGVGLGLATSRFGGRVMAAAYILAAAALAGLAFRGDGSMLTTLFAGIFGVTVVGGHVGNSVLAARLYPPEMNATGIGWAQALGRLGCVVGPALVGLAVAQDISNTAIFLGSSVVALVGAATVFGVAEYERRLRSSSPHG